MPFGKYENYPMSSVPAWYLCWLWNNGLKEESTPVAKYVRNHLHELSIEYPEGEWEDS